MRMSRWTALMIIPLVACGGGNSPHADNEPAGGQVPDGGTSDAGPADGDGVSATADDLHRFLEGRFDSADQASMDGRYWPVQLHACSVSAPELGTRVLYVEQAMLESVDRPYRQRIYVIEAGDDGTAVSVVNELADPGEWVGACNRDRPVIGEADVTPRPGCEVVVERNGQALVGGTRGKACASSLNGASYATSQVTITDSIVRSWDRGFDGMDTQVWGATAGHYVFKRRTPLRP